MEEELGISDYRRSVSEGRSRGCRKWPFEAHRHLGLSFRLVLFVMLVNELPFSFIWPSTPSPWVVPVGEAVSDLSVFLETPSSSCISSLLSPFLSKNSIFLSAGAFWTPSSSRNFIACSLSSLLESSVMGVPLVSSEPFSRGSVFSLLSSPRCQEGMGWDLDFE